VLIRAQGIDALTLLFGLLGDKVFLGQAVQVVVRLVVLAQRLVA
jgi:hypothetical protein